MSTFSTKLNIIAKDTNSCLKSFFLKQKKNSYLLKPMKYGVFSGGKRFRSTIIVNTGKIFNISYKKLIPIAAAVECIHSYSLIHDDLPAMDNDDVRRGKLSSREKRTCAPKTDMVPVPVRSSRRTPSSKMRSRRFR